MGPRFWVDGLPLATPDTLYRVLAGKARELGAPTRFTDDLHVHDKRALEENPGLRFLWFVRDSGTHLVFPPVASRTARGMVPPEWTNVPLAYENIAAGKTFSDLQGIYVHTFPTRDGYLDPVKPEAVGHILRDWGWRNEGASPDMAIGWRFTLDAHLAAWASAQRSAA